MDRIAEELIAWKNQRKQQARANALLVHHGLENLVHHEPGQIVHRNWEKEPRLDLKRAFLCARRTNEKKSDRMAREEDLMASSGFLAPKRIVKGV